MNELKKKYVVIKKPSSPEHEKAHFTLGFFDSREQAEQFVDLYCDDYTSRSELIIALPISPFSELCDDMVTEFKKTFEGA